MIGLDDVGKWVELTFDAWKPYHAKVLIQMVIKTPRGTLALFDTDPLFQAKQGKAIKAFMEAHLND